MCIYQVIHISNKPLLYISILLEETTIGGKENQNIRSIDHIKPLNQGGKHEIWNIVPMRRPYNCSKQDKNLLEWYKEQDFYSEERLHKIYEWGKYSFKKYARNE